MGAIEGGGVEKNLFIISNFLANTSSGFLVFGKCDTSINSKKI